MTVGPDAPSIAVIGVGNAFRSDDGVGWAVVDRLRARAQRHPLPPETLVSSCDGEPARLLSLWENAGAAIVIDAARAGAPARTGLVSRFRLDGPLPRAEPGATSSHGLGLAAAVELARVLQRLPPRLIVYAVEGGQFGLGNGLSAAVRAAVEPTAWRVEEEIRRLAFARHRSSQPGTADPHRD